MKEAVKNIFKSAGLYHPLQRSYYLFQRKLSSLYLRMVYSSRKGEGFMCNCCGESYREFAPWHPRPADAHAIETNRVIAGYGSNIICPGCASTARERLVIEMLRLHYSFQGKRVLLVSPEEKVAAYLKGKCDLVTGDLEPGFYRHIDSRVMKLDLLRLPFLDGCFDLVTANHVMEHIPDDQQAMKEVFRVLRPGGMAIMQVPFSETISETLEEKAPMSQKTRSALFGQRDHVRIYKLKDYTDRLEKSGFQVNVLYYASLSDFYHLAIQPGEHFLKLEKPVIS